MLRRPKRLVGTTPLMKINVEKAVGIENNKKDAIARFTAAVKPIPNSV